MLLFPVRCNGRGGGDARFTWWGECNGRRAALGQYAPDRPSEVPTCADCDRCLMVEERGDMGDLK